MKKAALSLIVIAASGAYVWAQPRGAQVDNLLGPMPDASGMQTGSIRPAAPDSSASSAAIRPKPVPFVTSEANGEPPSPVPVKPQALPTSLATPAAPSPQPTATATAAAPSPAAPSPAEPPPLPTPSTVAETAPAPGTVPASAAEAPPLPAPTAASNQVDIPLPRPRPANHQASRRGITAPVTPAAMRTASSSGTFTDGVYTGPVVDAYYGLMQIQAIIKGGRLVNIHVLRYPNDRRTSIYINRQALPMLFQEVVQAQTANVNIISGATLSSRAFLQSLGSALRQAGS